MTVEELIEELKKFPKELDVELDDGNFDYEIKHITQTVSTCDLEKIVCSFTLKQIII